MKKYRINWIAINTKVTGHGKPIFSTRALAQLSVDILNDKNEGVTRHWVEEVKTEAANDERIDG